MAARPLARPDFALPGAVPPAERADRSVSVPPGFGLVDTRSSVAQCCPLGSVPAVLAAGLVDLRPGRPVDRRICRDACATRDVEHDGRTVAAADVHAATLATLAAYATVTDTASLLADLGP